MSLNKHSQISTKEETDECVWNCEFCNAETVLPNNFTVNELPKTEVVTYCLTKPEEQKVEETKQEQKKIDTVNEEGSIIFCLDISGSMTGRGKLTTVQKVLTNKLNELAKDHPDKKLGLVLFGEVVSVCTGKPLDILKVVEEQTATPDEEMKEEETNTGFFGKLANKITGKSNAAPQV